jgi:hypothetical protein
VTTAHGFGLTSKDYPLRAASTNAVVRFVISVYTADRFIAARIVANICAVIRLRYLTMRSPKLDRTAFATETF